MNPFNITIYTADNTLMAKTFGMTDGKITQGFPGLIATGRFQTFQSSLKRLSEYFPTMPQNEALGLGTADLVNGRIVTKDKHYKLGSPAESIPRTKEYFKFRNQPTAMLLDIDGVDESIEVVLNILNSIIPGFKDAEKLITSSSSSGLYLGDQIIKNSTSKHIYVVAEDGTDIPRFMTVLFKCLWLIGKGRIAISDAGTLLERSLIDINVAAPERIIYEAPPVLNDGITQNRATPVYTPGTVVDTTLLTDLLPQAETKYEALVKEAKESRRDEAAKIAAEYDKRQAELVSDATGVTFEDALRSVRCRRDGQLASDDVIYLSKRSTLKVKDITTEHNGLTCCDPQEPSYRNWNNDVARIYVNDDGSVVINSFAHGGAKYWVRGTDPSVVFSDNPRLQSCATAQEVINKLSDMLVKHITADDWFPVVYSAKLKSEDLEGVLNFLANDPRYLPTKRVVKQEYNQRAADADADDKMNRLAGMAEDQGKSLIQFIPQDITKGVEETEKAMIENPGEWSYFNYGGMLAHTADDTPSWKSTSINDTTPPKVQVIKRYIRNSLFLRIEQSATFYQEKRDGPVSIPVPQEIINKLIDHPSPLAPKVSGLISHPILTTDGRVISTEGIDKQTGLLLDFGGTTFKTLGSVPQNLAAKWAKWINDSLFSEFIFLEHRESVIAALAFLMTGIFRKIIDIAPGVMITANMQGSGKTTLAQFIHVILTGRDMPVAGLGSNHDEMKKEMLATLIQSPAMICYDNILDGSEIRDQTLAKVLTASHLKGRLLGETKEVSVSTNSLLVMTGNNITVSADLARRFMTIRLTADDAQPECRTFRHDDVIQHCLNIRSDVIIGCLAITKGYIEAGSPKMNKNGSGFKEWDQMVRFPLLWATGVDVLDAIKSNKEQSTEHIAMNGLMSCLNQFYPNQQPFSSSDLLMKLEKKNWPLVNPQPSQNELLDQARECILNLSAKGLSGTRSLSWVLKKLTGRPINGLKLEYTCNSVGNYGKYVVTA